MVKPQSEVDPDYPLGFSKINQENIITLKKRKKRKVFTNYAMHIFQFL